MPIISISHLTSNGAQLVLPGVADPEWNIFTDRWCTGHWRDDWILHIRKHRRELIDIPVGGDDGAVATAMEARMEGGYKWSQMTLPGL